MGVQYLDIASLARASVGRGTVAVLTAFVADWLAMDVRVRDSFEALAADFDFC